MKSIFCLIVACLFGLLSSSVFASCFSPKDPTASPSAGVEMFYNIHLPNRKLKNPLSATEEDVIETGRGDAVNVVEGEPAEIIIPPQTIKSPGLIEGVAPVEVDEKFALSMPYDDLTNVAAPGGSQSFVRAPRYADPPYIWPNHIDPAVFDTKKLSKTGGAIFYYERDDKGQRRLCRVERWLSRSYRSDMGAEPKPRLREIPILTSARPSQAKHPILSALTRDYFLAGYSNIPYNAQGLVPRIGVVCFFYTADGQLRWMGFATASGECIDKKPGLGKSNVIEVLFDAKGKAYGAVGTDSREWTQAGEEGQPDKITKGWVQHWRYGYGGGTVEGYADSRKGISTIFSTGDLGSKDDNKYNRGFALGEDSPFWMGKNDIWRHYEFPSPMSTDLLKNPETLYEKDRVRIADGPISLYERFGNGGGNLLSRLWLINGNNNVPRQEFFKDGKLIRAVVSDYSTAEENEHLWVENLERYRPLIKVPFDNVYLRVYEYDASGKEYLVAIGWTNYPRAKWYAAKEKSTLAAYKEKLARMAGRFKKDNPKPPIPKELKYYFASPDGKVKYKNYEALERKYGPFQASGIDVMFPKGRNRD